jgi:lysophospholipase L1-like esterase
MQLRLPPRPDRPLLLAGTLAVVGVWLGIDAFVSGSLPRYRLVGCGLGAALTVPFVSLVLLPAAARRFWRRASFAVVPLALLLLLLEAGVRLFGPAPERPGVLLRDARLGHRNEPFTEGTDARGFRNARAPERTDVLFVGDSQTWGFGVEGDATFAATFAADTGRSSYQMANGSWGPVQYVELVRQGLALQPRLVVVTLFFGNDLVDAHDYAGLDGAETLRSPDVAYTVRDNPEFHAARSPNVAMALVDGVLDASRVLGFAARVVKSRLQGGALDLGPGDVAVDDAAVSTILRPTYRLPAVNDRRAAVRDGLAVTGRALAAIAQLCRGQGCELVVALLPTKELVYANWRQSRGTPLPELAAVQAAETSVRQELLATLRTANLRVLDLRDALQASLDRSEAPWPASGDGHLNATGHRLVARELQAIAPR